MCACLPDLQTDSFWCNSTACTSLASNTTLFVGQVACSVNYVLALAFFVFLNHLFQVALEAACGFEHVTDCYSSIGSFSLDALRILASIDLEDVVISVPFSRRQILLTNSVISAESRT